MARTVILVAFGIFLLGGLYASRGMLEAVWALAMVGRDIVAPAPAKVPDAVAASGKQEPLSGFAQKFSNRLLIMNDGTPTGFDSSKLAGVKYWAFYYSASWCGPCRAFTPDLVSFYQDFKPSHPNFELIFVNLDRSDADMIDYMKSDSMPWPAIWYADIDNPDLDAKKYCGRGIPCLVLVDADGQVLSDTFQNGQYTDPHHVIDDIRTIVK